MTKRISKISPGADVGSGRVRVRQGADQKTFAAEFDPQPFQLDEEAARDTIFRGGRERLAHGRADD